MIALKSGEVLAEMLNVNQVLEQNLDLAFFSPDLTVWKTALNTKYLITGQLGVNHELVQLENNFPRFNLLIGENESDEDILKRVIEKGRKLKKAIEKEPDKLNVAKEIDGIAKFEKNQENQYPYQCMDKRRRR